MIAVIIFKLINNNDLKYNFIVDNQKTIYVLVFVFNKFVFYELVFKFEVPFMLKYIIQRF